MLLNHLKLAWRNLKNNRMFSGINIVGLSLGLAITILLFMFISYERSYDKDYANSEDIYRTLIHTGESYDNQVFCTSPAALAPALKSDIPEVKYAARMLKHDFGQTAFIKVDEHNFLEKELYWCDPDLLSIFSMEFSRGNSDTALDRPNTVILSESTAKKYFADSNPIGKTIIVDNEKELEVTGVFQDFPGNSTLHSNMIGSFSSSWAADNPTWGNSSFETYIQLKKNTSIAATESQMQVILDKNVPKEGQWFTLSLQPMEKVHLYSSDYTNSYTNRVGSIDEIKNLAVLGLLILIIACVNYMNLMTARSQKRAKDVGINKTLGASSKSMIVRFYAETGLVTFIALVIGMVIAYLIVPIFNTITEQELDVSLLFNPEFFIGLFTFWAITTLVSGSYPAFYLSRSSPKAILNPEIKKTGGVVQIRKGLVVLQFAASVMLIVGIIVIYQQLQLMQNKKLGYEPENTVAISTMAIPEKVKTKALSQEFKSLSNVSDVAMAQGFPGITVSGRMLFRNQEDENGLRISTNRIDAEAIDLLKLKLLSGNMLPEIKQEGDTIIDVVLNKKAIRYLGYSVEDAIGKKALIGGFGGNATIVGVIDDFNFESLHEPIGAYAFHNAKTEPKSFALVRFNSASLPVIIGELEAVFKEVVPESGFEYVFLDKNLERFYSQERKTATLGLLFCVLAIFVACLGLFGLAAFMAEQRKKEIGVRKVLGASVFTITKMLSTDFVKLVFISLVISFPIAYWIMNDWLENFAYRININWTIFFIAGLIAIVIALLTVSFQSIKAAMVNPVKSLRTE
jgi:ABC-type antimicrobial peptide transport system permease subunit